MSRLRDRVGPLLRRARSVAGVPDPDAAGLPFEPAELESRIAWIFGAPRSGSTWLLEQLCDPLALDDRSPLGFRAPPGAGGAFDVLPVSEFLVSSHIAPALGEPLERGGELLPATLNSYLGAKPAYLFATESEDVWRPALRRLVLVRLHAVEAAARDAGLPVADRPTLVVKEVNGSHAADVVISLFPRSRLLFLVRDGRDVIDSLRHAVERDGWLAEAGTDLESDEQRLEWTRRASRDWACGVDATRRAYAAHPRGLRCMLRYEDLVADTRAELRSLTAWLGVERSSERVERVARRHAFDRIPADRRGAGQKRRAATPGLWREHLSADERALVQEVMAPRLAALGYAT